MSTLQIVIPFAERSWRFANTGLHHTQAPDPFRPSAARVKLEIADATGNDQVENCRSCGKTPRWLDI